MTSKRKMICEDCKNQWEVEFGTGERGVDMTCSKCGSKNVHRTDQKGQGFGNMPWGKKEK